MWIAAALLIAGGGLMTNLAESPPAANVGLAVLLIGLGTLLIWAALGVTAALAGTL